MSKFQTLFRALGVLFTLSGVGGGYLILGKYNEKVQEDIEKAKTIDDLKKDNLITNVRSRNRIWEHVKGKKYGGTLAKPGKSLLDWNGSWNTNWNTWYPNELQREENKNLIPAGFTNVDQLKEWCLKEAVDTNSKTNNNKLDAITVLCT